MYPPGGRSASLATVVVAVVCGCAAEGPLEPACVAPIVTRAAATTNTTNVLRAFVTADVHGADSVVVRYGIGAVRDSATPSLSPTGDSVAATVLGLEPSRTYGAQLVSFNACGATTSEVLTFTTAVLPADLPAYTAERIDPSPGYVVFGAGSYGLVIDNAGRVVWYHRFPDGPGLDFQAQPNGRYTARPPAPAGVVGAWMEIAPSGELTRTLRCARDLQPRPHDMIAQPDGSYWLLCDEVRTVDLSAQGASSTARVLGASVQHRSASGDLLFDWSAFDHQAVELNVLDAADRNAATVNWTHANGLDLDADGNLVVSFRNLSEVVKIDTRTGAVVWRLGGAHDQFTYENVVEPSPFVHQHGVRALAGGQLLLLDNLGQPFGSRAERYVLDEARHSARLSTAYTSAAGLLAQIGGSTQALGGGHTLVSYGSGAGVEEYDAAGKVVWRLTGSPGYVFRAQRIRSLYRPGDGDPR
ncbi:MAG: arylsulfotransferase family protein [Gemmatimonadaceae bacterium]